jgi:predicted small metal-binding protein
MTLVVRCADVTGDCSGVVRGETEHDILKGVAQHAKEVHGLDSVPPELASKAKASMHEE